MLYPDPTVQFQPHLQPPPTQSPSPPSTLISPPPVLISPPFLPFSLRALSFSPCSPAQLSLLFPFLFSNPQSSVLCPPALSDPLFPRFSARSCSFLFTRSLTPVYRPHRGFCPPGLFDLGLQRMSASGQGLASAASRARSRPMCPLQFLGFRFLGESSLMFTWIWLVLFLPANFSVISSQ